MLKFRVIGSIAAAAIIFASCSSGRENYLLDGLRENREEQQELLNLLDRNPEDPETRFALVNRISSNLMAEQRNGELILFLTSTVDGNPADPYAAYWLLLVAQAYLDQGANEMAGRITSYNVCYTKLLRMLTFLRFMTSVSKSKISRETKSAVNTEDTTPIARL